MRVISATAIFASIVACSSMSFGQEPRALNDQELAAALTDKEFFAKAADGKIYLMKFRSNNTADLVFGPKTLSGTWRIANSAYCTIWGLEQDKSKEKCFTAKKGSGQSIDVFTSDGKLNGTLTP